MQKQRFCHISIAHQSRGYSHTMGNPVSNLDLFTPRPQGEEMLEEETGQRGQLFLPGYLCILALYVRGKGYAGISRFFLCKGETCHAG